MSFLSIENLHVSYKREDRKRAYAVQGVNIELERRETLGIIGETGAGKTTTALSIMGLLPNRASVDAGSIRLDEKIELIGLNDASMRCIRGTRMAMIFQNPMSSLNPTMNIERQIAEGILLHNFDKKSKTQVHDRVDELLTLVGINPVMKRSYPHELSGGMRQRVGIAIALACNPELLIADEPTSALDVTIQAQVLALMNELKQRLEMSMLLITHDFGIIARMCDKVAVMYAGKIVESGTWDDMFLTKEHHPYTEGLFGAIPDINSHEHRLHPIPGVVADNTRVHEGCPFAGRCGRAEDICHTCPPEEYCSGTHVISCHLFGKGA